jgi:uncharacterized protein (TIGR03435 family)
MAVVLRVLALTLLGACILSAQATPAFEVASVRENRSVSGRTFMDGSGGRYTVTNATLRVLILNAFQLQDAQLVGGPGWINDARYDIVRRARRSDSNDDADAAGRSFQVEDPSRDS